MGERRAGFDPETWAGPLTAAAAVCLCVGTALAPGPGGWLVLPAVGLLLLACVSARDGFLLFGPFVKAELVRHSRRTRVHLWRTIAPLICGGAMVALHYAATEAADRPTPSQLANIAAGGYLYIGWHLFLFAFILTTSNLSNALVEERESKRADFLLSTDLRGREIVVGRSLARLLPVVSYPMAVLPLVAALPLLFQVDAALLLFSLLYAGVTLLSVAGLCAVASVLAADKKASGRISVMFIFPYLMVGAALLYLQTYPAVWAFPGTPRQPAAVSVEDLVHAFNAGNPFARFYGWIAAGSGDLGPVAHDLPGYAAFHLLVAVTAFGLAARWVRPAAAKIGDGGAAAGADKSSRPAVGDRPVYWKEVYLHPLMAPARRNPRQMRIASFLLIWLPVAVMLASAISDLGGYAAQVQVIARFYPALWAWIGTMSAARFALESLPRERERDALVSLLATPLTPAENARQRLWGTLRLCRPIPFGVGVLAVAGAACGGFPWLGIPALLLATGVFVFEMAAVGGLCGATAATIKSANARFGLYFAGLLLLPLMIGGGLLYLTDWGNSPLRFPLVAAVIPVGLMAPSAADQCPADELPLWAAGFLAGLVAHAVFGVWTWRRAVRLFVETCDPAAESGPLLPAPEPR